MMSKVRRPAVAGTFYPADAAALRRAIDDAFAAARPLPADAPAPKAIVVPHAGYRYSAAIAATAYRWLARNRSSIERVVLLGPSHRVWLRGMAVPECDVFDTPLGPVAVDRVACRSLLDLRSVVVDDRPHDQEHSLEVQLPFLQTVLDDFALVPVAVGDATTSEVADVVEALWGGPETLFVISTDLSHYHRYEVASRLDAGTAAAIVAMRPDAIDDRDACGARPLRGILHAATDHKLGAALVDLRNSGDTAGDHRRVVGYGAFVLA